MLLVPRSQTQESLRNHCAEVEVESRWGRGRDRQARAEGKAFGIGRCHGRASQQEEELNLGYGSDSIWNPLLSVYILSPHGFWVPFSSSVYPVLSDDAIKSEVRGSVPQARHHR